MEYFYGGGGNSNPDFTYRFRVKEIPPDMYRWCTEYPLTGPFERWHIKHKRIPYQGGEVDTVVIQIESRKAAYMFRLTFSEYIMEDLTYDFAKGDDW